VLGSGVGVAPDLVDLVRAGSAARGVGVQLVGAAVQVVGLDPGVAGVRPRLLGVELGLLGRQRLAAGPGGALGGLGPPLLGVELADGGELAVLLGLDPAVLASGGLTLAGQEGSQHEEGHHGEDDDDDDDRGVHLSWLPQWVGCESWRAAEAAMTLERVLVIAVLVLLVIFLLTVVI
jgi:hypothetical protein